MTGTAPVTKHAGMHACTALLTPVLTAVCGRPQHVWWHPPFYLMEEGQEKGAPVAG